MYNQKKLAKFMQAFDENSGSGGQFRLFEHGEPDRGAMEEWYEATFIGGTANAEAEATDMRMLLESYWKTALTARLTT